jgi:hypothetical protein
MVRKFLGNDLLTTFSRSSARNNRRNVYSSLLGNHQLNNASYYVTGFLWVRAVTIAMQQLNELSTMERPFSVESVQRGYLEDHRRYRAVSGQISKCEYVKMLSETEYVKTTGDRLKRLACNCVNV